MSYVERQKHETRESNQSLLLLAVSPTIWAIHFLASYLTAAVYCAKYAPPDGSLWPVRLAIAGYTAVALLGISVTALVAWRRWRFGDPEDRPHIDTPVVRHRFLGSATLLLSGLSAVATMFVALTAFFVENCR